MPRKRFRLDARQREQLRAALKAGDRPVDIARTFGVSRRTVYDYKKRMEDSALYSRSAVLTVRLNPRDLEALDRLAKKNGQSRAEIARAVLLRAVDVFLPDPVEVGEIGALTAQLVPIGRNLNQLVMAMNTANARNGLAMTPGTEDTVLGVAREIEQMGRQARRLLMRRAQIQRTRNAEIFEALGNPAAEGRVWAITPSKPVDRGQT